MGASESIALVLGYDTKPEYKFNCWNPKPAIAKRIQAQAADDTSGTE